MQWERLSVFFSSLHLSGVLRSNYGRTTKMSEYTKSLKSSLNEKCKPNQKYYYFDLSAPEFPVMCRGLPCCFWRKQIQGRACVTFKMVQCGLQSFFAPPPSLLIPTDSLKLPLNTLFDFAAMSLWPRCSRSITGLLVSQIRRWVWNQCWHLAGVRINTAQVSGGGKIDIPALLLLLLQGIFVCVHTRLTRRHIQIRLAGKFQLQVRGIGTILTSVTEMKKVQKICVFCGKRCDLSPLNCFLFLCACNTVLPQNKTPILYK